MDWVYDDGGRGRYFKGRNVRDCVVRSLAIASRNDYRYVYDLARKVSGDTPRNGVKAKHCHQLAALLGGRWVPCCGIGVKNRVHLVDSELPQGRIVCRVSGHLTAVIEGVIHDNHDPSRNGTRMVYGYWIFE